jgi:DNA-binding NarL/FixJ family response regulator
MGSFIRVLVVDDYEPWRRFVRLALVTYENLRIVGEGSDGVEAIQKARDLQPDLILLDIGLPSVNGIEAARIIRDVSSASKIIFLTENCFLDIAQEALRSSAGASGYVVKSDAGRELLAAVGSVLHGKQFVSSSLAIHRASPAHEDSSPRPKNHEAGFYSDDQHLIDALTLFTGSALKAGNAAIVVATEPHRERLLPRLQAYGHDVAGAIAQGRFVVLDAAQAISMFMQNGLPAPALFMKTAETLITTAAKFTDGASPRRVALCGECDPPLWKLGNGEAAICLEQLWNAISLRYEVDVLCAYSLATHGLIDGRLFGRICAEHSAVHRR